jgi:hypothetical protein
MRKHNRVTDCHDPLEGEGPRLSPGGAEEPAGEGGPRQRSLHGASGGNPCGWMHSGRKGGPPLGVLPKFSVHGLGVHNDILVRKLDVPLRDRWSGSVSAGGAAVDLDADPFGEFRPQSTCLL